MKVFRVLNYKISTSRYVIQYSTESDSALCNPARIRLGWRISMRENVTKSRDTVIMSRTNHSIFFFYISCCSPVSLQPVIFICFSWNLIFESSLSSFSVFYYCLASFLWYQRVHTYIVILLFSLLKYLLLKIITFFIISPLFLYSSSCFPSTYSL